MIFLFSPYILTFFQSQTFIFTSGFFFTTYSFFFFFCFDYSFILIFRLDTWNHMVFVFLCLITHSQILYLTPPVHFTLLCWRSMTKSFVPFTVLSEKTESYALPSWPGSFGTIALPANWEFHFYQCTFIFPISRVIQHWLFSLLIPSIRLGSQVIFPS